MNEQNIPQPNEPIKSSKHIWITIIAVIVTAIVVGSGTYLAMKAFAPQLAPVTSPSAQQVSGPNEDQTPSIDDESIKKQCFSRARVKERYELNTNGSIRYTFQTVSVDGKEIAATTVRTDRDGFIRQALVSLDCKHVAWVIQQKDAHDQNGTQVKPDILRSTSFDGTELIREVVLTAIGPATLHPFVASDALVSVGTPEVKEHDAPMESDLEGMFYKVDLTAGTTENIGGPFITVSPDFQFVVKRTDDAISLQARKNGQSVILADKTRNEFAVDFAFSPDSHYLAYLKLKGERGLLFGKLFRPISSDITEEIVHGELLVRDVAKGTEYALISGGYTVDSFRVNRWIADTELEWTEPETASRLYRTDVTKDGSSKKNELLDWEAF
jgi:hypothetical protein